ncbi:MAG TPA: hypothetical protein VGB75_13575 [Jatrophihabitans sp.]|jgi:hypothetical protein|uniref:hypothetical protein n=1 Tax=Jatrophihabitans sp. TaxID=1932789 RepID=UPI002EF4D0C6
MSRSALYASGVSQNRLRAQLAAGRWQLCGRAVVLHNGPLPRRQLWDAALINVGPRAMLTGFTAAEHLGLRGWVRNWVDVLAPAGATAPDVAGLPIRLHRTRLWQVAGDATAYRCQALPLALVIAARDFDSPRPACGLMAAAVQQRLADAPALLRAVQSPHCTRHRPSLRAALGDIAGGSQALSELDFAALCRRHRLPAPIKQAVRLDGMGRRRYLDASWRRRDGRLIGVEVDGALHLRPQHWWADQQRQNELVLDDTMILRFPSFVLRTEEATVARQLRRALWL